MGDVPKILIADDDVELLAILSQHLRKTKCTIVEARDGEEALALARKHHPDLMILDVMMPGLSGWEVAKRIRDDEALKHTSIIILTAVGASLNELTSPLYGADDKLDKPFEFAELDAKIKKVLGAHKTHHASKR